MPKEFRSRTANTVLVLVSLITTFAIVEAGYRYYKFSTYSVGKFAMDVVSGQAYYASGVMRMGFGPYAPDQSLVWRRFGPNGKVVVNASFRHNNFGWRSNVDYVSEKPKGTFRIAVLGDSFVASHLSTEFWVDEFHERLAPEIKNFSPEIENVEVYSFGSDGASFGYKAGVYCTAVTEFQPDLIIVNFIYEGVPRRHSIQPCEQAVRQIQAKTPFQEYPLLEMKHGAKLQVECSQPPFDPENSYCKPANLVFLPDDRVALNADRVTEIKTEIGLLFAPSRTLYARHSLAFDAAWYLLITRALAAETANGTSIQSDSEHAEEALRQIASSGVPVVLLRAPTEGDILDKRPLGRAFQKAISNISGVRSVSARTAVLDIAESEGIVQDQLALRMFNLPHDGHFSDEGSLLYGRAVAKLLLPVVMEHLARAPSNHD